MVTIGDVFSVVAALVAICASTWALILTMTLLFQRRIHTAQSVIEGRPWRAFLFGLALMLIVGTVGVGMLGNPVPGVKLFGMLITLAILSVAAVGAGGLSQLVGERMQPMDPNMSPYKAVGRGAGFVVVAGLLPFVGWWVFAPIVLIVSLGAGMMALMARSQSSPMEPTA